MNTTPVIWHPADSIVDYPEQYDQIYARVYRSIAWLSDTKTEPKRVQQVGTENDCGEYSL